MENSCGDGHVRWTSDTVMTMIMLMMMMLRGDREGNEGGGDDGDERSEETSDPDTRHRASTSMHWLTFRVRVMLP